MATDSTDRHASVDPARRDFLKWSDVPPGAVTLPMLDLHPSGVPGAEAF